MKYNNSFILIRTLLPFAILVSLSSCHGGVFGRPMGAYCMDNSDCRDPYVCDYGRCRSECKLDIDCPSGACVRSQIDSAASVCTDEGCQTKEDCPKGLNCGADKKCRSGCDNNGDCQGDKVCLEHACFDTKTNGSQAGAGGSAGFNNTGGSAGGGQPYTKIRVRGSIVTVKRTQSASGSIRVSESALHIVPRVCNDSGTCIIGGFVR